MKLDKLIEDLHAIREDLQSNGVDTATTDVFAGVQPTYPLRAVVLGATSGEEIADHVDEHEAEEVSKAVWLATGAATSYAPRALWDAI